MLDPAELGLLGLFLAAFLAGSVLPFPSEPALLALTAAGESAAAPDCASLAARLLGRRWWHFRLAHVGYFDRRSLTRAAERAGLEPVQWRRARWFFTIGYLASRVETYLPVARLNRFAERFAPLRWVYARVIPVNLFDSWVTLLRRPEGR